MTESYRKALLTVSQRLDEIRAREAEFRPAPNTLGVGSADIDWFLKGVVWEAWLTGLRKQATPEECHRIATEEGGYAVKRWNERGCRSRVYAGTIHTLHRDPRMAEDESFDVWRLWKSLTENAA